VDLLLSLLFIAAHGDGEVAALGRRMRKTAKRLTGAGGKASTHARRKGVNRPVVSGMKEAAKADIAVRRTRWRKIA